MFQYFKFVRFYTGDWRDSCCKRNVSGFINIIECHNYKLNQTLLQKYANTEVGLHENMNFVMTFNVFFCYQGCVDSVSKFIDENLLTIGACCVALAVLEVSKIKHTALIFYFTNYTVLQLLALIMACQLHRSLD